MRPEFFEASIQKGSIDLYVTSPRKVAVKNGAFIELSDNEIFYKVENSQIINIKKKFTSLGKDLIIKGNFLYKISVNDKINITFEEKEAVEIVPDSIIHNSEKYSFGDKIYAQGGSVSSSSSNVTGQYTEFTVTEVDDKGKIVKLKITAPGKYISPPSNPVSLMDRQGNITKVNVIFDESFSSSIIERDVADVNVTENETHISLHYPLLAEIEKGELSLSKQVISLDKPYAYDSFESETCHITFDFSPINGIPLMPPNSLDPQATYNEAIRIIENKLRNMESRIVDLENKNY